MANELRTEVEQVKEQEDVKRALKQTSTVKPDDKPKAETKDKLWLGTHVIVLASLLVFYFVLQFKVFGFAARFIPFVRTIVPMLAGTSEMKHHRFFIANVTGAAIWAAGIPVLGYWLGSAIDIDKYIYPIVAVIIVLSLIPPFLEWRKHKKASQQQV